MARGSRPLVITDPTLLVRHANDRLVMLRDRKVVAAMPIADISHIAVHGPVTFTGAAIARVLDAGLDITLHSSSGRFRGIVHAGDPKNVFLLLAQVDAWNRPERRLAFARPLIASKIDGQRQLLQRHALDHGSTACAAAVDRLAVFRRQVMEEQDLDAVRGFEGAAAAAYFDAFGDMLSGDWEFSGRVRRPPTDPVNALLSFGYTIAGSEIARHLTRASFDTRIGLLHGIRYGRESLSLDLLEEFRAPLVDRFTLGLLNRRQLKPEDFETGERGAVRLRDEGRRQYLECWEENLSARAPRLRKEGRQPGDDELQLATRIGAEEQGEAGEVTWRFRIERQVHRLARFLLRGAPYRSLHGGQSGRGDRAPAAGEPPVDDGGSHRSDEEADVSGTIDKDGTV